MEERQARLIFGCYFIPQVLKAPLKFVRVRPRPAPAPAAKAAPPPVRPCRCRAAGEQQIQFRDPVKSALAPSLSSG